MGFGSGIGRGYGLGLGRGFGRGRGRGLGRGSGRFSGYTCIKFFFFAFNVIFWLLGCAILGVGIWLHVAKGSYASLSPSFSFFSATALCITAGAIVLIVGFFGCCGAIMENQCLLLTYFLLVILIFLLETTVGLLSFLYWSGHVEPMLRQEMTTGIRKKYQDEEGLKTAWNTLQQKLKCCGVTNYTDWYRADVWPHKNYVPDSCCTVMTTNCGQTENPTHWYQNGCLNEMKNAVFSNLYILGIIAASIAVLQVFGLVSSMALFCCLRGDKYYE